MANQLDLPPIERVRVLHGHTNSESGYVKDDYPYGSLRCTIRFWIETATKGKAKGQQRFGRQTTNPKQPGQVWNKPHYSTYSQLAVLYLDEQDHVQWWGAGLWISPVQDARSRLMGIIDQLNYDEGRTYEALLAVSKRADSQWERFDETVTMLAAEISAESEDTLNIHNGVWTLATGRQIWLGEENLPMYFTLARRRVAGDEASA